MSGRFWVITEDEVIRLREMARKRLAQLSEARPVVRELPIAGLSPETLRYCVEESSEATSAAKSSATKKPSRVGDGTGLSSRRRLGESRPEIDEFTAAGREASRQVDIHRVEHAHSASHGEHAEIGLDGLVEEGANPSGLEVLLRYQLVPQEPWVASFSHDDDGVDGVHDGDVADFVKRLRDAVISPRKRGFIVVHHAVRAAVVQDPYR